MANHRSSTSPTARSALRCIRDAITERGEAPTVAEIGAQVGLRPSSIHCQLGELEAKGAIMREPVRSRGFRLTFRMLLAARKQPGPWQPGDDDAIEIGGHVTRARTVPSRHPDTVGVVVVDPATGTPLIGGITADRTRILGTHEPPTGMSLVEDVLA